jgi:Flp pilus assembly protein TadD
MSELAADHDEKARERIWVPCVLLCVISLWAFRNSFHVPFILDDYPYILDNGEIRRLWPLTPLLLGSTRPMLSLSLAVNYAISRENVWSYHAFNFCVHLAAGLLLFWIVRRTLLLPRYAPRFQNSATWSAFAVALIWLVHPLQTGSVTYVVQRCESMMGLFYLLTLYSLLRGATSVRSWPWYLLSVVTCAAGMGSKEVMATAPIVLALYDRVFLASSWRELVTRRGWLYGVFLAFASALFLSAMKLASAESSPTAGFGFQRVTPLAYLCSQAGVILHYLRLVFWPEPLCLDYKWPVAQTAREIVLPGILVTGLLFGSLAALRTRPAIGFLGLSFFLILAPTSSIMPIADLAFEHRMYLPLAAIIVLVVLGCRCCIDLTVADSATRSTVKRVLVGLVAALLVLKTIDRNRDYQDPEVMWRSVLEVAPHNHRAHLNLGRALADKRRFEEKREHYERALQLDPGYAKAHHNLAAWFAKAGDYEQATAHYEEAIRLNPRYVRAHVNFGNLFARQGDFDEAIKRYQQALDHDPNCALAHLRLGEVYLTRGELRKAVTALRQAKQLRPDMVNPRLRLAWILATAPDADLRDGQKAVELAESALRLQRNADYYTLDVLGAAYAEAGRFEEAVRKARAAYHLASAAESEGDMRAIQMRLEEYRRRQPHRIERIANLHTGQ